MTRAPLGWLTVTLALAACASEPSPPRKQDWGKGGSVLLPPSSGAHSDGAGVLRVDTLPTSASCGDDGPCSGYACDTAAGRCLTKCSAPAHCSQGYVCDDQTSVCLLATPCQNDSACGGYLCDQAKGACEVTCTFNLTCAPGYLCEPGGRCIPF